MSSNKPVGNNASSYQVPTSGVGEHARGQSADTKGSNASGAKDSYKDRGADAQKWHGDSETKDAFATGSEHHHHHHHKAHGHKGHKHAHGASDKQTGQTDSAAGNTGKKPVSSGSAASTKTGGSLDTGGNVGVVTESAKGTLIDLKVPSSAAKQVSSTPSSATTPAPTASTPAPKVTVPKTSTAAVAAPAAASVKAKSVASGAASGPAIGGAANSDGTPYDGSTGPIGAATAGPNDPTVTVKNNSTTARYYKIEGSAGSDPEKLSNNTFVLQPGQTATINPGAGFIGAITDQGSTTNAANDGTRQEVNFGQPGKTWYDADLERVGPGGAPNSTLGPTDTSLKADDGSNSLVGNQYAYLTPGSVAGQATSAAAAADDLKNRVISTQKMTITSS